MDDLRNKHFLVTGGTSGIGAATVRELACLGAKVTFVGRNRARAEALCAELPHVQYIECDLGGADAPERIIEAAYGGFGPLDGAANIACSTPTLVTLVELDDATLDLELCDELRSFARLLRAELRAISEAGRPASLVNVSSINGLGASPQAPAYSALKAAIIALSKNAALDYARRAIRVNALVPGPFDTPMLDAAITQLAGKDEGRRQQIAEHHKALIPLGRVGRPHEAADAIAWLLSERSSFVTGSSLIVDGGMTSFAR